MLHINLVNRHFLNTFVEEAIPDPGGDTKMKGYNPVRLSAHKGVQGQIQVGQEREQRHMWGGP
jgi:hypothetical protein